MIVSNLTVVCLTFIGTSWMECSVYAKVWVCISHMCFWEKYWINTCWIEGNISRDETGAIFGFENVREENVSITHCYIKFKFILFHTAETLYKQTNCRIWDCSSGANENYRTALVKALYK